MSQFLLIEDPANEVFVSPASYWEIAIKVALGKWQLNQPYEELIESLWTVYGFQILPICPQHTARLIGMTYHNHDPFDRLLAAQAMVEKVPLVSADQVFDKYGVPSIWA
jgi:PIN domain nuclease of toxin-antitoxin system